MIERITNINDYMAYNIMNREWTSPPTVRSTNHISITGHSANASYSASSSGGNSDSIVGSCSNGSKS
jgi:hypothetical protein